MKKPEELGLTLAEAWANTKDRVEWRRLIEGLCPRRNERLREGGSEWVIE